MKSKNLSGKAKDEPEIVDSEIHTVCLGTHQKDSIPRSESGAENSIL